MRRASLDRIEVADILPHVELPSASGGRSVALHSSHGEITVIYWPHSFSCVECDRYVQRLSAMSDEFRVWDARLLVLLPPPLSGKAQSLPFGTTAVNERWAMEGAGVMVADRYGQVFYIARADGSHTLPSVRELSEWLKHLGTLCPE